MSNLARVWFLLTLSSFAILIAGFYLGERQGLLIAFGIVLVLNTGVYFLADLRVRNLFNGRPMLGQDPWGLGEMVEELAAKTRIPRPEVVVVPLKVPTALSTGRHWHHSTIFLSEGLLAQLTPQELKAVLAHEISKIKRLDTFAQSVSSTFAGGLLWLARRLDRLMFRRRAKFERMFEPVALLPVHLSIPRSSYYAADELASHLIGGPQLLAQVLWKLHSFAGTQPLEIPTSTAHLFIVDPLTSSPFHRYFQKHPPIERRIEKLVGYFPV
ncbi:MAG TPA: M48 family metalloprotease [Bdellovibrionales bacterium]|nr:M48 family metalloprotease [Bdellovibrionales bacterium]